MAIFHLHAETGTRAGGQSASAKFDYLARLGRYSRQPDQVVHLVSGNMPSWAAERPRIYWESADLYERANGRLFKEIEAALPLELTHQQRVDLAQTFARHVAQVDGDGLPFTLALHEGKPKRKGGPANPHFHLVVSERQNDGHAREPSTWFKRSAVGKGKAPEDGGAPKTDALKPKEWLGRTRALWADLCNQALTAAGQAARVDHRSLEEQGEQRAPQVHLGPKAAAFESRTGRKSRRRGDLELIQVEAQAVDRARRQRAAQLREEVEVERNQALQLRMLATELAREDAKRLARQEAAKSALQGAAQSVVPTWQGVSGFLCVRRLAELVLI